MRMEKIFQDFELQLLAERQRTIELDAQEIRKSEQTKIAMADRLAGQIGSELKVMSGNSMYWTGVLTTVGQGWIQLSSNAENILIPQHALCWWEGKNSFSATDARPLARKLSLGYALRALATARLPLRFFHMVGETTTEGTIERVGLDFCEIALHPLEGSFRSKEITGYRIAPMQNISAVCSLNV